MARTNPTPDSAQWDKWREKHPAWADFDVIEATETGTRHGRYVTPLGLHYEADFPREGQDQEVSYRVQVDSEIVVLGAHPGHGAVEYDERGYPRTTIRASMPGRWFKTGTKSPA